MKVVKLIIADDSVIYRSQIRAALNSLPWVEVVGTASNGRLAIERLQQTPADLLILDLEMPEMDGPQVLKEIAKLGMQVKVLVFSSVSKRGAEITLEALRLGASDFIAKPGHGEVEKVTGQEVLPSDRIRQLLEPKIKALFPMLDLPIETGVKTVLINKSHFSSTIWDLYRPEVVVIGSSTGGPTVLEQIFSELSLPLSCPILITQHMPPIFTTALAERLQRISGIPSKEGTDGMPLEAGTVYVAPGDFHMTVARLNGRVVINLDQGPSINFVRPAVDPLFLSAAKVFKQKCLGIVLTGMGSDGKEGAIAIKNEGGVVLIQEESSCVVFGMPGAVKTSGAYDKILAPKEIITALQEKVAPSIRMPFKAAVAGGV